MAFDDILFLSIRNNTFSHKDKLLPERRNEYRTIKLSASVTYVNERKELIVKKKPIFIFC